MLIVDDHPILCEGLCALLSYCDDVEVVGEARNGEEAIVHVDELEPDVVLMDIAMPGMGGLEATRLIHEKHPETLVLVLTQHEESQYVMSLLRAGASGYVFKRALGSDLIAALRAVARGETFLHPPVTAVLVEELRRQAEAPAAALELLTPREKEILQYIVRGQTNAQIAEELFLSVKTVEWHRTNLMNKLDVHNVAQLMRHALEHGLVENDS